MALTLGIHFLGELLVRERTYIRRTTAHTHPMKRETTQSAPGVRASEGCSLGEASAEAVLYREIAELELWLAAQGVDVRDKHAHADEGSRDRLYWRYGYFVGLKQALALLTSGGATVH